MPFREGQSVGPYRIIQQLGQGGMATVFKAYHANLDRFVALKVLHQAFLDEPNFLGRFQREARVVAKLEHPNIVPVYDFSEHEGLPYLVMKFVEGETLKARLQAGAVSKEEGIRIIESVGAALGYAHKQGILHRDIKPSNVILANDRQIYLTDFGLARIASAGESTLSSDTMVGTPQYISPEQAVGKRDLDEGTDIYSFGVLIYELVVGRVPFSADTPFSIVHDHIYSPLPLPRSVNPRVPEAIERVLLKALAKERNDRFKTVDDLVQAFKRAAAGDSLRDLDVPQLTPADTLMFGEEVVAPPSGKQVDPLADMEEEKPRRRLRWWQILGLGIGLCLCAFLASRILGGRGQQGVDATLPATDSTGGALTGTPLPGATPLTTDTAALETALAEAEEDVAQNPEDPFGYLALANVLYALGQTEDANSALETAASLVNGQLAATPEDPYAHVNQAAVYYYQDLFGLADHLSDMLTELETASELAQGIPDFYVSTADLLTEESLWLLAVPYYYEALITPAGRASNADLLARFGQALYYAAKHPREDEFISAFLAGERNLSAALQGAFETARARHVLLFVSPESAEQIIAPYLTNENVDEIPPETRLVGAEIMIALHRRLDALRLLEGIPRSDRLPLWVRERARELLQELNPAP